MKSVTNQMNEEKGKVVKFGTDQLSNPTPTGAKMVFRIILWIAAMWALAAPSLTEIPKETLDVINRYLIIAVALVNGTIQFFGWDYPTGGKNEFYNGKR
jgi:hypothetical protein